MLQDALLKQGRILRYSKISVVSTGSKESIFIVVTQGPTALQALFSSTMTEQVLRKNFLTLQTPV